MDEPEKLKGTEKPNETTDRLDEIKRFIPNYHINLVDAARITNIDNYISDLQHVSYMIRYKKDTKDLQTYLMENEDYFDDMEEDSLQMMAMLLESEELLKIAGEKQQKGEKRSMCKALEDLYAEGIE